MSKLALFQIFRYDLIIARTDNQVDMRYMINMEYSNDLPINTLGRRIRTRLYFTSESHLHTLLNVLRFQSLEQNSKSCLLSQSGRDLISGTPELCYLTQIIIRLFENPTRDFNDPKRFRIEILFSPGATATPQHMAEMDRELDNSRFDCNPLQLISKENLTCTEVEEYFSESISQGETMDDEDVSLAAMEESRKEMLKKAHQKSNPIKKSTSELSLNSFPQDGPQHNTDSTEPTPCDPPAEEGNETPVKDQGKEANVILDTSKKLQKHEVNEKDSIFPGIEEKNDSNSSSAFNDKEKNTEMSEKSDKERVERMARRLARRYAVRGAATISLILGIGCLFFARRMKDDIEINIHRKRSRFT